MTTTARRTPRGSVTVGGFTGVWRVNKNARDRSHLVFGDETRCGLIFRRDVILAPPARYTQRCPMCADPNYCPDCGPTNGTHHETCIYNGQR